MSETPKNHRRQLRNYLIDPRMQLRFTGIMVVLTSALTAALGAAWYGEIRNASAVIQISAITALGTDAARSLEAELTRNDHRRLLLLVAFAVVLAFLVVLYSIVMSHKLAGPLFKIKRHMADIEEGRLYTMWGLRRGDQLQDFFAAFERMQGALRDRTQADIDLLEHLVGGIQRGDDLSAELPRLRAAIGGKAECLRDASQNTHELRRPTP